MTRSRMATKVTATVATQRDPGATGLSAHGIAGELCGDFARQAEALDRAAFGLRRRPGRIGFGRVPEMRLDLVGHAAGQRRIEIELAAQRRHVVLDHAGHARPPFSEASTACEKRPQALRRSASAEAPPLVSE